MSYECRLIIAQYIQNIARGFNHEDTSDMRINQLLV